MAPIPKVLSHIRAVPPDAHSHQTTDAGGSVKWKFSAECRVKPGDLGSGPALCRRSRLTINAGRSNSTKAIGGIIEVRLRCFDMRDRMAYTRPAMTFTSSAV